MNQEIESFLRVAVAKGKSTEINKLIEFEAVCGQAEGKSPRTVELTTLALRKLKEFLDENGLPTDAAMITADDIREFVMHLQACRPLASHPYARPQEGNLSDQ